MSRTEEQTFENHAKMVPLFHFVASPLLILCLFYFGWRTVTDFSGDRLAFMGVLVYLLILGFYARTFALGVQDRVIRLEERLRLQRLLPEEMRGRLPELTTRQLIALRFASDEEVVELASRVLDGELTRQKEIKAAVRSWRPDYERV